MQVQPPLQSSVFHSHAFPAPADPNASTYAHLNGVHSDTKHQYPACIDSNLTTDAMHPYQQPYAGGYPSGYGAPQQNPLQQQNPQHQHNIQQQHDPRQHQHHYQYQPQQQHQHEQRHQQQYPLQQQYSTNQLPPMYASSSMPPMAPPTAFTSSVQQGPMYPLSDPSMPPIPYMAPPSHQSQQPQKKPSERQRPALSYSGHTDQYNFELKVEQQPQRARMCGFGDKDRRPITPPPCIKLILTDRITGEEISPDQVYGTFFVLQVDLWDADGFKEVNIVRSSGASPAASISTATVTSFPPAEPSRPVDMYGNASLYPGVPPGYFPPPPVTFPGQPPMPAFIAGSSSSSPSMFTRNLIGSLTVNASVLKDPQDKPGFWFVLQDLSVRTEGWFR